MVNGWKDIENRTWPTLVRGPVLIHAAKEMTHEEYRDCFKFAMSRGVGIPAETALQRGGIVGTAYLCACLKKSPSKWFTGPYGFKFRDALPLPFAPLRGDRGFFEVANIYPES